MPLDSIPFCDTGYFSKLICDYLDQHADLQSFYHRVPALESFKAQLEEKKRSFPLENRKVLASSCKKQYKNVSISEESRINIDLLEEETTFTVVTGHQLNLFTGPLYFVYKIIAAINLTKKLKKAYPSYNFVPIYWMATEDHDFDEINYFNLFGKKIQWNRASGGAVGRMNTEGLDKVCDILSNEMGLGDHAAELVNLFKSAYLQHETLAAATRYLANELFKSYGLVILDGDDRDLKRLFIPYIKNELEKKQAHTHVMPAVESLKDKGYKVQVNPRETNLFYLDDRIRERIIKTDQGYKVNDTSIAWDEEALMTHLQEEPERFSPNVIMRPLYQEVILPNLCYIGGGGELAYWLELKSYFESEKIPFPILLLRNSVLLVSQKQWGKLEKLSISHKELFLKQHELINLKVRQISDIDIDFSAQRTHLKHQFLQLYDLAQKTDVTFMNAVKAQEVKQIKGLDTLEKRLLKAQRNKLSDQVKRITRLQDELFPGQSLQERYKNFSEFYLDYGKSLIAVLMKEIHPLASEFLILEV